MTSKDWMMLAGAAAHTKAYGLCGTAALLWGYTDYRRADLYWALKQYGPRLWRWGLYRPYSAYAWDLTPEGDRRRVEWCVKQARRADANELREMR